MDTSKGFSEFSRLLNSLKNPDLGPLMEISLLCLGHIMDLTLCYGPSKYGFLVPEGNL